MPFMREYKTGQIFVKNPSMLRRSMKNRQSLPINTAEQAALLSIAAAKPAASIEHADRPLCQLACATAGKGRMTGTDHFAGQICCDAAERRLSGHV